MVTILEEARFKEILAAIQVQDQARLEEILAPIADLIPDPVNALELRGPSWTKSVRGLALPPGPPPISPGRGRVAVMTMLTTGEPWPGVTVTFTHRGQTAVVLTVITNPEGLASREIEAGSYTAHADIGTGPASVDLDVQANVDQSIVVALTPPAGAPPPPGGGGPGEARPEAAPPGIAPPTPAPPAGTQEALAPLAVGQDVFVYGALPGRVSAIPEAAGGMYEVTLTTGIRVAASRAQISAVPTAAGPRL